MIPRVSDTSTRLMALWMNYENWKTRCQSALLAGALCMALSLLSFLAGMALQFGWFESPAPKEDPVPLFLLSLVLMVGGIVANVLYQRWRPHRRYALECYQKESAIDVW